MRRSLAVALLLITALTACESDAKKLERLQQERAVACLPVYVADSTARAVALATARIESKSARSVEESQENVDVLRRRLAEVQRQANLTEQQLAAEEKAERDQRLACSLAERALNQFMRGGE